ncbi:hypothetical protein [Methylorubrum thiocyanatum]|uniref:hypothetical protein n=1 Tax=Methylorubrum thiocyanatum TaxID=47958 RepID=UPI0036557225
MYATEQNFDILTQNDYQVAMQLSLSVTDGGGLAPSFTFIESPSFSFGGSFNINQSREQNYFQNLTFSMRKLDQQYKRQSKNNENYEKDYCALRDTNLAGRLGLRDAFEVGMSAGSGLKTERVTLSDTSGSFGGRITFTVEKSLSMVGPTWTLRHFRGPGGLAGVSEMNTDKITFAFAKGEGAPNFYPGTGPVGIAKAQDLLQQINIDQLSTQLGNINRALR